MLNSEIRLGPRLEDSGPGRAHDSQRHQDKAHDIRRQEATRACSGPCASGLDFPPRRRSLHHGQRWSLGHKPTNQPTKRPTEQPRVSATSSVTKFGQTCNISAARCQSFGVESEILPDSSIGWGNPDYWWRELRECGNRKGKWLLRLWTRFSAENFNRSEVS